jgi:hypothetical protein
MSKKLDRMPLSALLSQVLVAFTIEFDNEFEHQVPHQTTNHGPATRGVPWLVSRVMWSNFLQFVDEEGTTICRTTRWSCTEAVSRTDVDPLE